DAALDAIQEFEPVFERRLLQRLPLVVALFSDEKLPLLPYSFGVDLPLHTFCGATLPTDLPSHAHLGNSILATAMAAMPSSRPRKPKCSLVVAFMPMYLTFRLRAKAMCCF